MTILKRRYRGDPIKKGYWYLNDQADISVICPKCGGIGNLNNHKIEEADARGLAAVKPSLHCSCGFHDTVILKDWNEDRD